MAVLVFLVVVCSILGAFNLWMWLRLRGRCQCACKALPDSDVGDVDSCPVHPYDCADAVSIGGRKSDSLGGDVLAIDASKSVYIYNADVYSGGSGEIEEG